MNASMPAVRPSPRPPTEARLLAPEPVWRPPLLRPALLGLTVLVVGCVLVGDGTVSGTERSVFRTINGLPDELYPVAWPLQQLGALAAAVVVGALAALARRSRLSLAVAVVTVSKLGGERLVKLIVTRERPATTIGAHVVRRGDVPVGGASFVSGHAVLVSALAGVVTPYLPRRWRFAPAIVVLGVMWGRVYVGAHNPLDVVCGAALGLVIAAVTNRVVGIDGARRHRRSVRAIGPVAAALLCVACVSSRGTPAPSAAPDITVGSFDFTESRLLAEIYSQSIESTGVPVHRAFALGPREFVGPALAAGLIDLVPEYAGAAADFHRLRHDDGTVQALASAPAQDGNTFVTTAETARRLRLATLSDLAVVAPDLRFGGPAECPGRRLCLAGLTDVYGIEFGEFVPLDAGGPLTAQALRSGQIDVALMFSSDPLLSEGAFVELADDRGLQPAENITPFVSTAASAAWEPETVRAIDAVSAQLTTAALRDLNREAQVPGADLADVARRWLATVAVATSPTTVIEEQS